MPREAPAATSPTTPLMFNKENNDPPRRFPMHPYSYCLAALVLAWVLGMSLHWLMMKLEWIPAPHRLQMTVMIGSGIVAITAGLPGCLGELTHRGEKPTAPVTFGFSVGFLIRLFGTVALLGLCRYQMPAAKTEGAGLVLAWYCYLTAVTILVLAKLFPLTDRKPLASGLDPVKTDKIQSERPRPLGVSPHNRPPE